MSVMQRNEIGEHSLGENGDSRSTALIILNEVAGFFSRMLGLALMVAVVVNFANVIGRYGFNEPLTGADELQVYLMIGMAFLGGLVAQIRQRHLRMDVLVRAFPPSIARLVNGAEALLTIAVSGLMTWVSWNYTIRIFLLGSRSENAGIALWIPHSVLAIAFTLMMLAAVARVFAKRVFDKRVFSRGRS
jgi:TRAP-type C4-dicarboxylate transport system permease small subunit